MLNYFFPLLAIFYAVTAHSQTVQLREITALPAELAETSGITVSNANLIWSHNDSGGEPVLYSVDTLGTIGRTLTVTNATNVDWEDLTQDAQGNVYIGDFGNNANSRKNLCIYTIPNPDSFVENSVTAGIIRFTYADQTAFPPADAQKNFDAEAFVALNDSLFLFSKNQTNPFSGYTRLYKLPAIPGTYTLMPVDSFLVDPAPVKGQITSAAISPDGKTLALLTYGQLLLFRNFTGSHFFKGTVTRLAFPAITQKEAVCFINDCHLYLTDEALLGTGRHLYRATICQATGLQKSLVNPAIHLAAPRPNPSQTYITCSYNLPISVFGGELVLTNANGQTIRRILVENTAKSAQISTAGLLSGVYHCTLRTVSGTSATHKVVSSK